MMGVEGGTEISSKSALDMSTKHGLLYTWKQDRNFRNKSKPSLGTIGIF